MRRPRRARPLETTYEREVLRDSPALYLPMQETAGTLADRSGNGRDGTVTGSTVGVPGPFGQRAVDLLSSAGNYVQVADNAAFSSSAFTLETLVRPTATLNYDADLFGKYTGISGGSEWWFGFVSTGGVQFYMFQSNASTWRRYDAATLPTVNQWNHMAVTFDGSSTAVIYLNGNPLTTTLGVGPTGSRAGDTATAPRIGQDNAVSEHFTGQVAHAAYYATALPAARIRAHYDAMVRGIR